ncbi:MAG: ABC transporter ATP-binding protein [Chloroflexota bacterium]|jgi:peptide/nickel transport system ATP-binding protein|nr:ABC transporter ATP-binding protein [Chloroflexota bacterium]
MAASTDFVETRSKADLRGTADSGASTILSIEDLWVDYKTPSGWMPAVRGASMEIRRGEAVALIGESGSGKSTLGFALLRMLARSARISRGSVRFTTGKGQELDLLALPDKDFRKIRWQEIAMTFQAAQNSLNPVMRVKDTFLETARAHGIRNRNEVRDRTLDLLAKVQLDADRVYNAYPHELSGGMRQRVSIALSLFLRPELIILDEPTTALDILTQRAIIDVVRNLREELDFTMIFISHDLSLAAELADRVATMYAGEVVEYGPVREVFYHPRHPYSVGLMNAVPPIAGEEFTPLTAIPGSTPNMLAIPSGCPFHPRCPFHTEICVTDHPPLEHLGGSHHAACHHHDKVVKDPERWESMDDVQEVVS